MKYLIVVFLNLSALSYSQDILVKINGDTIAAKINEIGLNEIKFKKFNNQEGPQYIVSKKEVSKIIFNNGEVEHFSIIEENKDVSIEELKEIIIKNINKFAYSYTTGKNYTAEFEGNYLKLTPYSKLTTRKFTISSYYYDFSVECNFHDLSLRSNGISYINVFVTKLYKKNEKFVSRGIDKLVIKVQGHKNGKNLQDALISYSYFFIKDN
jgi:hypothetical protein